MANDRMTSMERVLTAIGHREPDRIPQMLFLSLYGARECGLTPREYFSDPVLVAQTQLAMREKYSNDVLYPFLYAAVETEAWGGDVLWSEDGPPNAGEPVLRGAEDIRRLTVPDVARQERLQHVLTMIRLMKAAVGTSVPIIGVVVSPFSLPIMQMGFEPYLKLLLTEPDLFGRLMETNAAFCTRWANAQLDAGATAICWFDPLASPTIIDRKTWLRTGYPVAKQTMPHIRGPVAMHLASGRTLPVLEDIVSLKAAVLGISEADDLPAIKERAAGRVCLLGNLNAIDMVNWTPEQAEEKVKALIRGAGRGGGFILSDQHGEIPWQVPSETLLAVAEANRKWGTYPLDWLRGCDDA